MALINKNQDFSGWYNQLVQDAGLSEYSEVKGCILVLPYGYSLWESMQRELDKQIKKMGASNMAFPMLIPYSYFERESDHIEGFVPEVALVTSAGGKKLEEPLVLRPTSEVIIHEWFAKKIRSWRDLPLKVNQWCSVIRWEKRPRPFIRTTEFWWQEGHTVHATLTEAKKQAWQAIEMYRDFCHNVLAIPVIIGKKPLVERFAGAETTLTIEGMMQDGKAVQMGTSHILGEGFVKAVNIAFQDTDMQMSHPSLTSWGVTTRLIGALVMVHGDQKGLIMPPHVAPILICIIPIWKNNAEKDIVFDFIARLTAYLDYYAISYYLDTRDFITPGAKFYDAEIKGYPFRLDIGVRDIQKEKLFFILRDTGHKVMAEVNLFSDLQSHVGFDFIHRLKKEMHERLFMKAFIFRKNNISIMNQLLSISVDNFEAQGFYLAMWCQDDYAIIKEKQLTVRCVLPRDFNFEKEFDFICSQLDCCVHGANCIKNKEKEYVIIAKCY